MVYLLHFGEAYYHARHYIGYTDNLEARLERHIRGDGSPLVKAVHDAGIEVVVARVWEEGNRDFERNLKQLKATPRLLCPICRDERRRVGNVRP